MRPNPRMISPALVGAALLALGSACEGLGTGAEITSEIRISFHNLTGRPISVIVDGASFSPTTVNAAPCGGSGCTTDEFLGLENDVISFNASAAGISGSGNCRAGAGIVGIAPAPFGAEYGSVQFTLSGTTISITCSTGWQ